MSRQVIWGCGTPGCDAGFRVHLAQTWIRLQCRALGHKSVKTPIYHFQASGSSGLTRTILGYKWRCTRCNTDQKEPQ